MGKPTGFLEHGRELPKKLDPSVRIEDNKEFVLNEEFGDKINTQASRCMDCGVPFCHNGCPIGNIIPEFTGDVITFAVYIYLTRPIQRLDHPLVDQAARTVLTSFILKLFKIEVTRVIRGRLVHRCHRAQRVVDRTGVALATRHNELHDGWQQR